MRYTVNMEIRHIDSPSNDKVKALARLQKKKGRAESGRMLAEGWHLCEEAENAGLLETILCTEEARTKYSGNADVIICSQRVLDKLSLQDSGNEIIGVVKIPQWNITDAKRALLLDDVQDPGNLGTLVRSAVSFGIDVIYCSAGCADPFNPKTVQSSQGAIFRIPVVRCDLHATVDELKQHMPVYAAALHRDSIALHDLISPADYALMLGNEGQGIHPDLIDACTQTVHIEMDTFESLNVAVAGSILMYCLRQKMEG